MQISIKLTCFDASSERQSYLGRNGMSISSGGAASGVEQLWSEERYMGKCCKTIQEDTRSTQHTNLATVKKISIEKYM